MTLGDRCCLVMNRKKNDGSVGREREREGRSRRWKEETWAAGAVGCGSFLA